MMAIANQANLSQSLATAKVLRNTYMLLSMTLLFSAMAAIVAIVTHAAPVSFFVILIVAIGLPFAINATKNSGMGILLVFVFTGFMGYTLGPVIAHYLSMSNGPEIVATSLGLTAFAFLSLSGYVLITGKDFNFMGGFLFVGTMVVIGASLVALAFSYFGGYDISGISLAISAVVVILSSGWILYETSRIVNGGETNYVMATLTLFIQIYNLFLSLLHLVGFAAGDD